MRDLSNSADTLDVRDLIERLEELETDRDSLTTDRDTAQEAWNEAAAAFEEADPITQRNGVDPSGELGDELAAARMALREWEEDEAPELAALESFLSEFKGYGGDHQWRGDWYPVTFIRDSYWKEFAQDFAEEIGAVNSDAGWPNNCIDWDQAARELQMDYTGGGFEGVTYWAR